MSNRRVSLFLTVVVSLAGASAAQVFSLSWLLLFGLRSPEGSSIAFLWAWLVLTGIGTSCGLLGGYRAIRSGAVGDPFLLAFLIAYCLTMRTGQLSLGWPFQLHAGIVFGPVGLGANLVGVGLLACRWQLQRAERAKFSESNDPVAAELE